MDDDIRGVPLGENTQRNLADNLPSLVAQLPVAREGNHVFSKSVEEPADRGGVADGPKPGISTDRLRTHDPYDTAASPRDPAAAGALSLGFDRWHRLVGLDWARVLASQGLGSSGSVVEIGPGFTDKVGQGLAALRFQGTLRLVEPTASACTWACDRYRGLLPAARVLALSTSLADASTSTATSIDALVSNHVLDDMLLRAAVDPSSRDVLFSEMQPGAPCTSFFVRAWFRLMADQRRLDRLGSAVAEEFAQYAAATRPRLIVINQYPSWTHLRAGLAFIHQQALRVMHLLEKRLFKLGHARQRVPASLYLRNPAKWLIMSQGPLRVR
jgi:hypothetical protein